MPNVSRSWDVVVVGSGPAGSSAACAVSRAGMRVLLVDAKRFPRRKVCGGCLNRVSIGLLRQLLEPESRLWASAIPLKSFELTHRARRLSFPTPEGLAVDRATLDACLVEAAQASGVTFLAPAKARLGPCDQTGRQLTLTTPDESATVHAKIVILATGLGNRSACGDEHLQQIVHPSSRVGIEAILDRFPPEYRDRAIHMVVGRHGYVGLTRIAGGRLHVAAAVDRSNLQAHGPAETTRRILREAGAKELFEDASTAWRGTPPLTARARRLGSERTLLVGDAAGYVEPFTGEGIRWALQSGLGVSAYAIQAVKAWQPSVTASWEVWYRKNIQAEQRLCRRLSWGLKQPVVRLFAHQVLRASPILASKIISTLNTKV